MKKPANNLLKKALDSVVSCHSRIFHSTKVSARFLAFACPYCGRQGKLIPDNNTFYNPARNKIS